MKLYCLSGHPTLPCNVLKFKSTTIMLDCGLDTTAVLNFLPLPLVHSPRLSKLPGWVSKDGSINLEKELKECGGRVFVDSQPELCLPERELMDLSTIDVILISNYHCMMALPYITEHSGFTGAVYATEPTLQIGRLLMEELVNHMERVPKDQSATCWKNKEIQRLLPVPLKDVEEVWAWKRCYTIQEVNSALSKVQLVGYSQKVVKGSPSPPPHGPVDSTRCKHPTSGLCCCCCCCSPGVVWRCAGVPSELRLLIGQLQLDHPITLREGLLYVRLLPPHHTSTADGPELAEEQRYPDPDGPYPDAHCEPRRHAGRVLQQPGHDDPRGGQRAGAVLLVGGDLRPAGVPVPVHRQRQPGQHALLLHLPHRQQLPGVLPDLRRVALPQQTVQGVPPGAPLPPRRADPDQQAEALPQHPRGLQQRVPAALCGLHRPPLTALWGRGPLHGAVGPLHPQHHHLHRARLLLPGRPGPLPAPGHEVCLLPHRHAPQLPPGVKAAQGDPAAPRGVSGAVHPAPARPVPPLRPDAGAAGRAPPLPEGLGAHAALQAELRAHPPAARAGQVPGALGGQTGRLRGNRLRDAAVQGQQAHADVSAQTAPGSPHQEEEAGVGGTPRGAGPQAPAERGGAPGRLPGHPAQARHQRGEGGGDGRRPHPAPAGGGRAHPDGGGRHAHRVRQQRAHAHHATRPGAALPAEALTSDTPPPAGSTAPADVLVKGPLF